MPREMRITDAKRGAAFTVRVVTRAQRDELVGIQEDGSVKVRLMASPAEGQANLALVKFLAARLGVPENAVEIVAGHQHRDKVVSVEGISTDEAEARLQPDPGVSNDG